jgi:diguanylate cyclase (GGDEF)-like protein
VIAHATTLNEAVDLASQVQFTAALVDLTLPDASKCDVALALRIAAPNLPMVALTGHDFDSVGLELIRAGVQDYLQKGAESIERIHQVLQLSIERERQRAQLKLEACHDALTGVLNRREFEMHLAKAISRAERTSSIGAVILIDIDDFKRINDTLGHHAGDQVLCTIANQLSGALRAGDAVARLGGDEFVALIENLKSASDIGSISRKVRDATCGRFVVDGHPLTVATSIGASAFPIHGNNPLDLVRQADKAMYRSKRNGKVSDSSLEPASRVAK